jgi:Flp pilus assembly protein TadG
MVEMALAFPILLLILAGTLEVGKYFNDYLTVLDATREARYAANGDLTLAQEPSASATTTSTIRQRVWLGQRCAQQAVAETDDIVVSAMSVDSTGHIIARYPRRVPSLPPSFLPTTVM